MTHFINGSWVEGLGKALRTVSPVDGSKLFDKKEADASQVEEAALAAKGALLPWTSLSFNDRIEYVLSFKNLLQENAKDLAFVISQETGKPLWESEQETLTMVEKVALSQAAFRDRCRVTEMQSGQHGIKTHFRAKGALAVLGPYNFPGHLPNGHIIPALIAGNTVVFKPSEKTPLTGKFYAHIMEKAGMPPGVFNLVQGGKEVGLSLANADVLDGLLFTGSHTAGLSLSKIFGNYPKKILALEMGGNNPLIIDEVSNLDFACFIALQSAFLSAGQRCSCARRLIIQEGAFADRFLKELVKKTERLKIGAPLEVPFMGPLITIEARDNVLHAQENLLSLGAVKLLKAQKIFDKGAFISPGILDVTSIKEKPDGEIFGPFLQVIRVRDFQEALEEANNTRFGLTASLVSEKRALFELFQKGVQAGIVNWNAPTTGASSKSAFGGLKESGNNRPSAFFAADYCSSPIACMEVEALNLPKNLPPGMVL